MNIYEAIHAVMEDVGAIGKDSRNSSQGFMFRGIDAVMNKLNPALIKHKVFVVPEILEQTREERVNTKGTNLIYSICKIKYTFYAEDGTNVQAIVIGEGMDTGDKATNKAMSIAFKYACFQVFCIPTEEMVDPDSESHEVAPTTPAIEHATQAQLNAISTFCKNHRINENKLYASMNIDFKTLTKKDATELLMGLKKKYPDKPENEQP